MYKEIIKLDTSENWNKAKNFIPKLGEIIIYEDSNFLRRFFMPSTSSLPVLCDV